MKIDAVNLLRFADKSRKNKNARIKEFFQNTFSFRRKNHTKGTLK